VLVGTNVLTVVNGAARHATLQTWSPSSRLLMQAGTRLLRVHLYYRSLCTSSTSRA
jgi:hypothetical protein